MSNIELTFEAKRVLETGNTLGESIVWDWRSDHLVWVDIDAGLVLRWAPASQESAERFAFDERVAAVGLAADGDYVIALESSFVLLDWRTKRVRTIAHVQHVDPAIRLNDGRVAPDGSFVCGGMHEADEQKGLSRLYRLMPDGRVFELLEGVHCANALAWSPDSQTMYFADMYFRKVNQYQWRPAGVTFAGTLFDCELTGGSPDGADVDDEGCLWLALWDAGKVVRISPSGMLLGEVPLPTTNPTCLTFGGPELETLYITTAQVGLSDSQRLAEKTAGDLFAVCASGINGRKSHIFGA